MIDPRWVTVFGLALDIIGVIIVGYGLIISKQKAVALGGSYWGGDDAEKSVKIPPVQDRLLQSRNTIIGGAFLVAGFLCQLYGSWPR